MSEEKKKKRTEVIKWANLIMQDQKLRPKEVVGESGLGKTTSIRCILHRYGESKLDRMQDMRLDFTKITDHITAQWETTYTEIQQNLIWEGSGSRFAFAPFSFGVPLLHHTTHAQDD